MVIMDDNDVRLIGVGYRNCEGTLTIRVVDFCLFKNKVRVLH